MKYAFLFPGQGAQEVGMGKTLLEEFAAARRVFEVADGALGFPLSDMILNGPESELQKTEFTQPAIMTVGIALHSVLVEELGVTPAPICSAGHSLGEYTAHVAAGTLALEDAVRLVHLRGKLMQEAVPLGVGAMAAIMGLSAEETEAACREVSDEGRVCEAANYNAPNQTVISGHREAVDEAVKRAKRAGSEKSDSPQSERSVPLLFDETHGAHASERVQGSFLASPFLFHRGECERRTCGGAARRKGCSVSANLQPREMGRIDSHDGTPRCGNFH